MKHLGLFPMVMNPLNFGGTLLGQVAAKCCPNLPKGQLGKDIQRAFEAAYPMSTLLFHDYVDALKTADWEGLPDTILLPPLTQVCDLQAPQSKPEAFQAMWPLSMVAGLNRLEPPLKCIHEPKSEDIGSADIFAYPQGSAPAHFRPTSRYTLPDGQPVHGVFLECKAITSHSKVQNRLEKAAQQLNRCSGGVAAIDVSGIIAPKIGNAGRFTSFWNAVYGAHQEIHDDCIRLLDRRPDRFASILGLIISCRLVAATRSLKDQISGIQLFEYRESFVHVPKWFRTSEGFQAGASAFKSFLADASPGRTRIYLFPEKGHVFHIPPAHRITFQVRLDASGEPMVLIELTEQPTPQRTGPAPMWYFYGELTGSPTKLYRQSVTTGLVHIRGPWGPSGQPMLIKVTPFTSGSNRGLIID